MIMKDLTEHGYPGYSIREDGEVFKGDKICKSSRQGPQMMLHARVHNKMVACHRLVALAFHPNPEGYKYVMFHDENSRNLHYTNIFWTDKYRAAKREQIIKMLKLGYGRGEIRVKGRVSSAYIEVIWQEYKETIELWRYGQALEPLSSYPDYAPKDFLK